MFLYLSLLPFHSLLLCHSNKWINLEIYFIYFKDRRQNDMDSWNERNLWDSSMSHGFKVGLGCFSAFEKFITILLCICFQPQDKHNLAYCQTMLNYVFYLSFSYKSLSSASPGELWLWLLNSTSYLKICKSILYMRKPSTFIITLWFGVHNRTESSFVCLKHTSFYAWFRCLSLGGLPGNSLCCIGWKSSPWSF